MAENKNKNKAKDKKDENQLMEKIVSLAKRRGFIFQSSRYMEVKLMLGLRPIGVGPNAMSKMLGGTL